MKFDLATENDGRLVEKIVCLNSTIPLEFLFSDATFLHGSSSAVFAYFEKLNCHHLIPTGLLRKQYNAFPASGELSFGTIGLFGRRKQGINYEYLSGYASSMQVQDAISYSRNFSRFDLQEAHKLFTDESLAELTELPVETECPITRRVRVKKLEINLQNLITLDPDWENNKISLLQRLQHALNENSHSPLTTKYLKQFITTIEENIRPFESDERFKSLVNNQFPVVWVSNTLRPHPFSRGMPGEHLIKGAIDLKVHIQSVITPKEHAGELKDLLEQHGLGHIKVFEYQVVREVQQMVASSSEDQSINYINTKIDLDEDDNYNNSNAI